MRPALLVIDLQQEFFQTGPLAERRDRLAHAVNELVDGAHEAKIPVIWIRQEYKADLSDAPLYNRKNNKPVTIEGTEGVKLLLELHQHEGDIEIIKKRFSSFFQTNLEAVLKEKRIDTLILTGINTMTCVRTTAIDAYMRDYYVILALDGVDAYDSEQHENSLKYLQYAVARGLHNDEVLSLL